MSSSKLDLGVESSPKEPFFIVRGVYYVDLIRPRCLILVKKKMLRQDEFGIHTGQRIFQGSCSSPQRPRSGPQSFLWILVDQRRTDDPKANWTAYNPHHHLIPILLHPAAAPTVPFSSLPPALFSLMTFCRRTNNPIKNHQPT